MTEDFLRNRITQLRLKKGVSEYQMSYDLGHSRGYVYNISSGKSFPPYREFLAICDYFGITPLQFFDARLENPMLINKVVCNMAQMDEENIQFLVSLTAKMIKPGSGTATAAQASDIKTDTQIYRLQTPVSSSAAEDAAATQSPEEETAQDFSSI